MAACLITMGTTYAITKRESARSAYAKGYERGYVASADDVTTGATMTYLSCNAEPPACDKQRFLSQWVQRWHLSTLEEGAYKLKDQAK